MCFVSVCVRERGQGKVVKICPSCCAPGVRLTTLSLLGKSPIATDPAWIQRHQCYYNINHNIKKQSG